jgi:hypothetical protein
LVAHARTRHTTHTRRTRHRGNERTARREGDAPRRLGQRWCGGTREWVKLRKALSTSRPAPFTKPARRHSSCIS